MIFASQNIGLPLLHHIYLASRPKALQHNVKQLAHSPQRPLLVSNSFSGLLYLNEKKKKNSSVIYNTKNRIFICVCVCDPASFSAKHALILTTAWSFSCFSLGS